MAQGTRDALVDAGERLLRSKGYAAFSYADLAEDVGIKKASIHHHFPTKEELGVAIVEAYIAKLRHMFATVEETHPGIKARLAAFGAGFEQGAERGLLPLCGALAAEMAALPTSLQRLTRQFLEIQLDWLTKVLDEAVARGEIRGTKTRRKAHRILSILEGGSFVNWGLSQPTAVDHEAIELIVDSP